MSVDSTLTHAAVHPHDSCLITSLADRDACCVIIHATQQQIHHWLPFRLPSPRSPVAVATAATVARVAAAATGVTTAAAGVPTAATDVTAAATGGSTAAVAAAARVPTAAADVTAAAAGGALLLGETTEQHIEVSADVAIENLNIYVGINCLKRLSSSFNFGESDLMRAEEETIHVFRFHAVVVEQQETPHAAARQHFRCDRTYASYADNRHCLLSNGSIVLHHSQALQSQQSRVWTIFV